MQYSEQDIRSPKKTPVRLYFSEFAKEESCQVRRDSSDTSVEEKE